MAEYLKAPAKNLHRFPETLSFEEACLTEPLVCCVQAVFQHGTLSPNGYVAVMGPGTIGLLTLQVIRLFGCKATGGPHRHGQDRAAGVRNQRRGRCGGTRRSIC